MSKDNQNPPSKSVAILNGQIIIYNDLPKLPDLLEGEAELVSKFFQFLIPPNANDN